MKPPFRFALALALAVSSVPVRADALLDQILTVARAAAPAPFTRTVTARQRGGKSTEPPRVSVERFDPARPVDERWTLVSVDGRAPTPAEQRRFRDSRKDEPVPGYHRIAAMLGTGAVRSTGADGRIAYRVARMPKGSVSIGGRDLSAHVSAEAIVGGAARAPFIEQLRFSSAKPFRMMLIARVDHFDGVTHYARRPGGGVPRPATQTSEITGSLAGSKGTLLVETEYRAD